MKVLHVTPWYAPAWASGGIAVAATQLCEGLVKLGIDVTVYTTTDAGGDQVLSNKTYSDTLNGVHVSYHSSGFFNFRFRRAALSFGLCRALFSNLKDFDLVHIHSVRQIYGIATMLLCRWHRIPYLITPHAALMEYWMTNIGNRRLKTIYAKTIDKHVLQNANAIHFLTEFEAETSSQFTYNNNFFVLANGVSDIVTNYQAPKSSGRPLKLLCVGRIHPQKNTLSLIKAVSKFPETLVQLDHVGAVYDHHYNSLCQDAVDHATNKNIRLLGPLPSDRVIQMYSKYDILCMPSYVEGVSMAIIEAASQGVPALVTNGVGNFREILEDKAGILTTFDEENIAARIISLLETPELVAEMKAEARKSFEKRYQIDLVCEKLVEEYSLILCAHEHDAP